MTGSHPAHARRGSSPFLTSDTRASGATRSRPGRERIATAFLVALGCVGCKGSPDSGPWCSLAPEAASPAAEDAGAPPTYHAAARPIIAERCVLCHQEGGLAPFSLSTYADVSKYQGQASAAILEHAMPPWAAASCCSGYFRDRSLRAAEQTVLERFFAAGAPEGDPATAAPLPPLEAPLSRVDVRVGMKSAYTPAPTDGSTDDMRCFLLDWPANVAGYVTGLSPLPGQRKLVHHMIVFAIDGDEIATAEKLEGSDGRPGFDCKSKLGSFRKAVALGGSMVGGDFPRGVGKKVDAGSKILLNIHYSTAHAPAVPDTTAVEFRIDPAARDLKVIPVGNLAWVAGDAMKIPAGEKDAVFFYRYRPSLLTGDKRVKLQGVTPHMHEYGTRITVRALRDDGSRTCLLEIPRWRFGWEQPYFFSEEKTLGKDDEVYIECHFDNSAANQKGGRAPRDIAWGGNDQDMCAAFIAFTEE